MESSLHYPIKPFLPLAILTVILTGCAGVQKHTSPQFASSYAEHIYHESEVTVAPRMVTGPPVKKPGTLIGQAETILSVIITSNGSVVVEDVISQTEGPFTIAAIEAVNLTKFYPGLLNGRPVATRIELPFNRSAKGVGYSGQFEPDARPAPFVTGPSWDISGK